MTGDDLETLRRLALERFKHVPEAAKRRVMSERGVSDSLIDWLLRPAADTEETTP